MISDEGKGERAVLLTLLFVLVLRRIEIGHSACVFEQMDRQTKKKTEYRTIHLDPDICSSSSFVVRETIDTTNI